jgi:hypothetical protein
MPGGNRCNICYKPIENTLLGRELKRRYEGRTNTFEETVWEIGMIMLYNKQYIETLVGETQYQYFINEVMHHDKDEENTEFQDLLKTMLQTFRTKFRENQWLRQAIHDMYELCKRKKGKGREFYIHHIITQAPGRRVTNAQADLVRIGGTPQPRWTSKGIAALDSLFKAYWIPNIFITKSEQHEGTKRTWIKEEDAEYERKKRKDRIEAHRRQH